MSLDILLESGEKIYFQKYREKLEKECFGFYVVIDVESEKCVIDSDKLKAFELAQQSFGEEKLFFAVQIGAIDEPTVNSKENASLSWAL